ncbi:MAG: hypothetical protein HYX49_11405 [Chloroflexi bacterium]|nr:hypothetical protein [Chloroflexota bacterium]
MNKSSKVKGTLEVLLVIGLILLIPLFFAIKSVANAPIAQGTGTPYARATATSVPQSNPSVSSSSPIQTNAKQPPACTFPLANITTKEATPEEYTFSEPQVVLTAPQGNPLNVAQWLPDNQQVLVTEELANQWKGGNPNDIQESISLYNLETGESKLYAIGPGIGETPMWLPELNGVVYSSVTYSNLNPKDGALETHRKLWGSYGDPNTVQLLADNLQLPFIAKPDGSRFMYLSNKQIAKLDKTLKKFSSSSSFDPDQWDYAKSRRDKNPVRYNMAWQPNTSLVFLYNRAGIGYSEGGYTFILDTATGHVCELNFGGWASNAHWSSDGRYLAFARSKSYTGTDDSPGVVVLDSITGNLRTVGATLPDAEGEHQIDDFTWTPDNLHLLAFANVPSHYDLNRRETYYYDLYLIDLTSDQSIHLFPEFKSFGGSGNNFVWSPDDSKLLVRCPLSSALLVTDRYCLISVQSVKR